MYLEAGLLEQAKGDEDVEGSTVEEADIVVEGSCVLWIDCRVHIAYHILDLVSIESIAVLLVCEGVDKDEGRNVEESNDENAGEKLSEGRRFFFTFCETHFLTSFRRCL